MEDKKVPENSDEENLNNDEEGSEKEEEDSREGSEEEQKGQEGSEKEGEGSQGEGEQEDKGEESEKTGEGEEEKGSEEESEGEEEGKESEEEGSEEKGEGEEEKGSSESGKEEEKESEEEEPEEAEVESKEPEELGEEPEEPLEEKGVEPEEPEEPQDKKGEEPKEPEEPQEEEETEEEEEGEEEEEEYESEYEVEGNLIKLFYPDIDSPIKFYEFYEMTQFGSEIVEKFEPYKDYTNYQEYNNIYRETIKKIDPETGKSHYEFIFLFDLDYYGNDPFLVPYSYSVLSYFTAEFNYQVINFNPSDKAWVYAVFVSEKLGLIMKTSLKLLFYLSKDNIDVRDLQLHPHTTYLDIINFLKMWDKAASQAQAINLNDHYVPRFKLSILLTRDNILKFISQFPNYLIDHVCELFVVRAYDPENYERLIDPGMLKEITDKFDPGVLNQVVPEILKPENFSLWLNNSNKEFITDFLELLKLKVGIQSKTPYDVCSECMKLKEKEESQPDNNEENEEESEPENGKDVNQKSSSKKEQITKPNCENCKFKVVYFPIHIWNKVNDIYLKWNKTDVNGINRNIKWAQYLNEAVYIDKLHYDKSIILDNNTAKSAKTLKLPRTWEQVDEYGFRPDYRLYDTPQINKKISPFEGRLFFGADEKTCGTEFLFKVDRYNDLKKFMAFYSKFLGFELKILPPFLYSSALFYYFKDNVRHFVIFSDKTIWKAFDQIDSRVMKMLYFNNDMSNIELFFYDFHTITKIGLDVFMQYRTEVIKFHSAIGGLIDVVLDMQNRGWNFDLFFEEPYLPISIYYNYTVEHTWYKDDDTHEFVDPFSSEELAKIEELESYVPYIRSIKLFSIQKNNPDFYDKMVKYFPAEDEEENDDFRDGNDEIPSYEKSIDEIVDEWARKHPQYFLEGNEDEDEDEDESK